MRRLIQRRIPRLAAATLIAVIGFGGLATGRALRQPQATAGGSALAPATNQISGQLGTGATPTPTATQSRVAAPLDNAPPRRTPVVSEPQPAPPASAQPGHGPKHDNHDRGSTHVPGPPAQHPPHGSKLPRKKS